MIQTDLIIIVCLILSAFFSGMEIAFVSSNRIYLEIEKSQQGFTSKVLKSITQKPSRFIATMLLGNNVALVLYGIFMGDRILQIFYPQTLLSGETSLFIVFYQTLISTAIILLTAEFLPKVFFRLYANTFIKIFSIPVAFFYAFFYPITFLIIEFTDLILKQFFKTGSDKVQLSFSKVELGNYIDEQLESFNDKENLDSEIQIFQNALEFSKVRAREVMVPRTEIISVDRNIKPNELNKIFIQTGLSKILIHRENIDNIVGHVSLMDMFKEYKNFKSIIKPVEYIPESMFINDILNLLTKNRKNIALVIDEYGGTSGIITKEDIIEELFGEIEDEHDSPNFLENKLKENLFLFSARLEVGYLNDQYKLDIPVSDQYETLGGFIVHRNQDIPLIKEVLKIDQFEFKIKEVSNTKIETVELKVLN